VTTADRAPPTPAWVVPYLRDFEEVLHVVELAGGFVLLPIEVPGPDLARALGEWLSARGHPAVVNEPETDEEWKDLTGWLLTTEPPPEGVVLVLGSRKPPDGVFLALRLVNERRDSIVTRLQCPLFWCGPPSFLQLTRERAPDFWSVRALERRLSAAAAEALPMPPSAERPRIDLLDEAHQQRDTRSTGVLTLQRARELLDAGKPSEARAVLDEPILRGTEPALYAELLLLQAELARRRGGTDEALDLLGRIRPGDADRSLRCRVRLATGRVYESAGDDARAALEYTRGAEEARLAADPALIALSSVRIGALQLRTGQASEAALRSVEEARALAAKAGDLALEALATALLAGETSRLHDRKRGEALAGEARELAARAKGRPSLLVPGETEAPPKQDGLPDPSPVLGPAPLSPIEIAQDLLDISSFDGVSRAIVDLCSGPLGYRYVTLWDDPSGTRAPLCQVGSRPQGAGVRTVVLTARGEAVGRLEVDADNATPAGSTFEQLIPWFGLALASAQRPRNLDGERARRLALAQEMLRLTDRQAQVLDLVSRGRANKEIAMSLQIETGTVEIHVGAILRKAGVESRTALVAWFWSL
jgi:DNA-binding CsgD family transcriptional regulator